MVWLLAISGCWSADPLIDGAFTQDQWTKLHELRLPRSPDPCKFAGLGPTVCAEGLSLAKDLFVDRALSVNSTVSCESCHDALTAWIDVRSPNDVSMGAIGPTRRNSMSLFNLGLKREQKPGQQVFTWNGAYTTPGQVLELALEKAMGSPALATPSLTQAAAHTQLAKAVRANSAHSAKVSALYGSVTDDDELLYRRILLLFEGYLTEFSTRETPFDYYLDGESDALTDSQKRGFAIFAGRGGCIECHSGALLTDLGFHNTGVEQRPVKQKDGSIRPVDQGRAEITKGSTDAGKFLTGSLREIAITGPYMHDGRYATLADVIAFYRRGGDAGQFLENRDPRIVPLDITDDDAADLEAFLHALSECTAATCPHHHPPQDAGVPDAPSDARTIDAPGPDSDAPPGLCPPMLSPCGTPVVCVDEFHDPANCGGCGRACFSYQMCSQGSCM